MCEVVFVYFKTLTAFTMEGFLEFFCQGRPTRILVLSAAYLFI